MKFIWPQEFPGVHWIDDQEEQALLDVMRNGSMFRYYGIKAPHHVDDFEKAACEYYGVKHALAVSSGTGALTCAMSALNVGPGCEVIVPAFMWVASVGAIIQSGAIPVIAEVDASFNLDPNSVRERITKRTALIVAIHMAGSPCDMDAIMAVANEHSIPVLEDCAQCNGGSYHGRKVGSIGAMAIFSLQLNKNITCGEGGLLVTNDTRLYERAFAAHDMGMIRREGRLSQPGDDTLSWGQGRRMSELSGAVAGVQFKKLPMIVDRMRASKRRIKASLTGIPGLTFRTIHDVEGDAAPFIIMILEDAPRAAQLLSDLRREGFANAMLIADYGLHIYSNIVALVRKTPLSSAGNPWALTENRASQYDYNRGECPRSDELFSRSVLVPVPSKLTLEQEEYAVQVIKKSLAGSGNA